MAMAHILGIIAEYNPFHNGHLHHLEEAKRLSKADATVAVMSGDFVQRGEPALLDKWVRARVAVACGIDLVLELPFIYACNQAAYFARGAVAILSGLGCVDSVAFGSESADLEGIYTRARVLAEDGDAFGEKLREMMKSGSSFPKAKQEAISSLLGDESLAAPDGPNDILATEYLKQLILLHSKMTPIPIRRFGASPEGVSSALNIAGASAIRDLLADGKAEEAIRYLPQASRRELKEFVSDPRKRMLFMEDLRQLLIYAVLYAVPGCCGRFADCAGPVGLSEIFSATEGLERRLIAAVRAGHNMEEMIRLTKTKRYTRTRIKRLMIHTVMGLTKETFKDAVAEGLYARVLAFSERGAELIRYAKKSGSVPLITNPNREKGVLRPYRRTFGFDIRAADIRRLMLSGCLSGFLDFSNNPVRMPSD
jgi:predicted nucleotidyltransferase